MPVKFDKRLSDFGSFLVRYLITTLNAGKLSHRSLLGLISMAELVGEVTL